MRVVLIGVGNLGSAIVRSLRHTRSSDEIVLVERDLEDHARLSTLYGCRVVAELSEQCSVGPKDLLILSVKPQDAVLACTNSAPFVSSDALILSMMAGVKTATLSRILKNQKIVRAMPNLGASIDESATGYFCTPGLALEEVERVTAVISRLGRSWQVEREELIDALTAVAGSGPAYLCWLGEQVERLAIEFGISALDAHAIVLQTFRGTVLYLEQSALSFAELRARVTSPQGTTAAAMSVLKERSAERAVGDAISAACKRAEELGN